MQGNIENKLHDWSPERQTSQEATRLWLEAYYSNAEGDLIFATPSGISWRRYTTASLKDCSLDAVASQVHGKSQLYLKINTMDRKRIIERGKSAVGKNCELIEIVSFHADIDCDKRPSYPTRSFALEKLHNLELHPSMIVGSGGPYQGGLHVSWLLDTPLMVSDQLNELRALSKRFQAYIAEAIQPHESDKLSNLERVLRVVGSVRTDGVPVALLELNERRYSIEDIRNACPAKATTVQATKPITGTSLPPTPSGSSRIISGYLAAKGSTFEELLRECGWKLVGTENGQNLWQRPNAPADATPVSARQGIGKNGQPGIWNFSGNAELEVDSWHGAESLFVHYRFAGDWKKAASYCYQEMSVEHITVAPPEPANQFTVTQWREMQAENFQHTIIGLNLERSPMGTGKTAAATKLIASGSWGATTFCCASHANCVEIERTLSDLGVPVGLYPTVSEANCINAAEAQRAMQIGLPIVSTVCAQCPNKVQARDGLPACVYHRERIKAENESIRIGTHARLVYSEMANESTTVVIDEDALSTIRKIVSLTKQELHGARSWWLASGLEQGSVCAAVCDELLCAIERGGAVHERVYLPLLKCKSSGWHRTVWEDKAAPQAALTAVMRVAAGDFAEVGACSSNAVAIFSSQGFDNKRVVYLDTTASVDLLKRALYRTTIRGADLTEITASEPPIKDITPQGNVTIAQRPVQIPELDITIGKDYVAKAKRLARYIVALIAQHDYERVSVIGHSKHVDSVKKYIPRAFHWRLLDFFYFRQGPDRGSNYWHNMRCDCLLIAGTPRVPIDALRDQLAAFGYWGVPIPDMVSCKVHVGGATFTSWKYPRVEVQAVYEYLVNAPLLQAIGGARPLQAEVKCDTYILSNALVTSWQPQICAAGNLGLITERIVNVAEVVATLSKDGQAVSTAQVCGQLAMHDRYTRKVLQVAKQLNLVSQLSERSGYLPAPIWTRKPTCHL